MNDDLILNNLNLIYFVLKQMGLYKEHERYYDTGLLGLVKAAKNFDPDKGNKFATVAVKYIEREILVDIIQSKRLKRKSNNNTISLDSVIYEDESGEGIFLIDMIPSEFNLEEYIIKKTDIELLRKAILTLDIKERALLRYCYGPVKYTQSEIAKIYNTTQSNISRRLKHIIAKLRVAMNIEGR